MKGYMLRAIWEFAQSADCVAQTEYPQNACNLQIAQTVEPQVLLQQPQIPASWIACDDAPTTVCYAWVQFGSRNWSYQST